VFLTPTRMDSQGVSRDEAMSSGLVPITTSVTAIPEFVDSESGILVPGEDYKAMADAIIRLVNDPVLFDKLSSGAAERVRQQSRSQKIISAEIKLITSEELE
jgi:glycosyltransferase involved in cell wall biosynthesis